MVGFKERLDSALKHRVWFLGGPLWSQELDLMISMGPLQLGIFREPVIFLVKK